MWNASEANYEKLQGIIYHWPFLSIHRCCSTCWVTPTACLLRETSPHGLESYQYPKFSVKNMVPSLLLNRSTNVYQLTGQKSRKTKCKFMFSLPFSYSCVQLGQSRLANLLSSLHGPIHCNEWKEIAVHRTLLRQNSFVFDLIPWNYSICLSIHKLYYCNCI